MRYLLVLFFSLNAVADILLDPYTLRVSPNRPNDIIAVLEDDDNNVLCKFLPTLNKYVYDLITDARENNRYIKLGNCDKMVLKTIREVDNKIARSKTSMENVWIVVRPSDARIGPKKHSDKKLFNIKMLKKNESFVLHYDRAAMILQSKLILAKERNQNLAINLTALKSPMRQRFLIESELVEFFDENKTEDCK